MRIQHIATDQIRPNAWNPNHMTGSEFQEFVAEVKHLGRLPKPIIARQNHDGYEIVDGEHAWRAAKETGLTEVPVEVVDVDDFEAMRQTYKRNQHGSHDPVLEGRMFRAMKKARKLTNRKLAAEVNLSEGTVRNALAYADAADRFGNDTAVKCLGVRQVRLYLKMPPIIGGWWLSSHAKIEDVLDHPSLPESDQFAVKFHRLEETGLCEFNTRKYTFRDKVRQIKEWDAYERQYTRAGLERDVIRGYTQHYFSGVFYVRDPNLLSSALDIIFDPASKSFCLTPEEFADCIAACKNEASSANNFQDRLRLRVIQKMGKPLESNGWIEETLAQERLQEAPDFIRDLNTFTDYKDQLFEMYKMAADKADHANMEAIERAAREGKFPCRGKDETVAEAVRAVVNRHEHDVEYRHEMTRRAQFPNEEIASAIVGLFYGTDAVNSGEGESLCLKLAGFEKWELLGLLNLVEQSARFGALLGHNSRARKFCIEELKAECVTVTQSTQAPSGDCSG